MGAKAKSETKISLQAETALIVMRDQILSDNRKAKKKLDKKAKSKNAKGKRAKKLKKFLEGVEENAKVDALDSYGTWYTGTVGFVATGVAGGALLIQFDEWPERFDEWIPRYSGRVRPHKSVAPGGRISKGIR